MNLPFKIFFTYLIVFLLKNTTYAQWKQPMSDPLSNLLHTSDTGFVCSGYTSRGFNAVKFDKAGNKLWEKWIEESEPKFSLETVDGYIGGAVNSILKVDKNGNTIYSIFNTIYQPIGLFKNTILLKGNDSLGRFNHVLGSSI